MKLSKDNGKNWGEEIALRTDGGTWDLGYPRMVVRPDGKVLSCIIIILRRIPHSILV